MLDYHRDLLNELSAVGLKGKLSDTRGNHVRIEWEVGGNLYSYITAKTPSDVRGRLNARAGIRRKLREAGLYRTLEKKKSNGVIATRSTEDRIAQLELDVVTLLDMLEEVRASKTSGFAEGWDAAATAVQDALKRSVGRQQGSAEVVEPPRKAAVTAPTTVAATPVTAPKKQLPSKRHALLLQMPLGQWLKLTEIVKRTGRTYKAVSLALHYLKCGGLVEHDKKAHKWRKRVEAVK